MQPPPPLDRLVPAHVQRLEAYIPSQPDAELMRLYGCERLFRMNNNENALGPPPAAQEVIRAYEAGRASLYPSGDAFYLRRRLADYYGHDPACFLVGDGADELIALVVRAFCEEGDNIVTADRTFATYEWVATFGGVEARLAPLRDHAVDAEAMLARLDERTKVIFICNPNNPTGTYLTQAALTAFLERVGGRQIVVLDEAYAEFVARPDYPDGMRLLGEYPNLVVFRTFSKLYGLAALRVGYLAGAPDVVEMMRRVYVSYSVNAIGQAAAAAALGDAEHIARTRRMAEEGKTFLRGELARLGLPALGGIDRDGVRTSEGNFLLVKLPVNDALAYRRLMQRGVMVRAMTGFRFPNCIRITVGHEEALRACVRALEGVV